MYSRESGDRTYTFEPSGGLLNASLVMVDKETDSYWSIISDEAIHGPAAGQPLVQVPGSVKTTFGDWRSRHPGTRVLSVEGREHEPSSPYDSYFSAEEGGFRDWAARDSRLADRTLLFGFHYEGAPHAVPFAAFEQGGGAVILGDGRQLFLYREQQDSFYRSTAAFLAPAGGRFERDGGAWTLVEADRPVSAFDPQRRSFGTALEPFPGFDTFWYIWSLTNEGTEVLAG